MYIMLNVKFFGRFFCILRPAFGHGRLGHPQSLEYWVFDTKCITCTVFSLVFKNLRLVTFLVQACLRAPHVVADEAKLAIVFTYFFLSFFFLSFSFSYAFCFSPTSGNLPCVKICFPQYFGITRRYMQNKYIFWR